MERLVCVEVDILTSSVIEMSTGLTFETDAINIDSQFVKSIHKKDGWKFNWKREYKNPLREIFKLTLKKNKYILLGMISLEIKYDHVHVHLVESSPANIGKQNNSWASAEIFLHLLVKFQKIVDLKATYHS